jgi:hypothetical protein
MVRKAAVALLVASALAVSSGAAWAQASCPWLELDLAGAQQDERVGVLIRGTGNFHGDAIQVTITAPAEVGVRVDVPLGTVLRSSVPQEQDMVVHGVRGRLDEDRYIDVADVMEVGCGEETTFVLEAYCLDLEKETPATSTTFEATGLADAPVLSVLNASPPPGSDVTFAIQDAVWVATGDLALAGIAPEDVVTHTILERAGLAMPSSSDEPAEGGEMVDNSWLIIVAAIVAVVGVIALLLL